jgi:hypothetical protein
MKELFMRASRYETNIKKICGSQVEKPQCEEEGANLAVGNRGRQ